MIPYRTIAAFPWAQKVSYKEFPFHEVANGNCESEIGTSRKHTKFPRTDNIMADEEMTNGICVYEIFFDGL